ncbi:CBS domain-containing protein [Nonlabens xylanidelens]|uniref:CBS domain-containing protein n=1 Tax=Nonlabens xylanidelens TaxID=191564 RepID=A0A2S6IRR2_9FLAO|nr:CBS domain-containing protein [Nonlabens xylanidelens]PPK96845.1 CBS domain-containing protein [Nonlabens xylanidelens]PQJ13544.1 acetoin utilization protein acuB [Nonlabens xylanidelens]
MDIKQYIINDVKPLDISSDMKKAQEIFSQLTYSHLPIMENDIYIGCLSENDAHCFESDQKLQTVKYSMTAFHVKEETHWLDVLEAFAQHQSNMMPVLDGKNEYLGYYELKDIMELFNDAPFMYESGAVVVVQKGSNDYSFSEVAQIVESNDSKIFGCFVSNYNDHMSEITLKLSPQNLNTVLQTFRRYSYEIVSAAEEDSYLDTLKERSDYLNKYLNM